MGFIGRNGAGKTTTLKSLLNLVHPDSGNITFFGAPFLEKEQEIKKRIGVAMGGVGYYLRKKIREIAVAAKVFYPNWDDPSYWKYLERFSLDQEKRLVELSEGMKVKFSLALALSHQAELLVLDEPTSGLDPVSREELLEIFLELSSQEVAILFSTHITSDLEKCADAVTYIRKGKILASDTTDKLRDRYRLVRLYPQMAREQQAALLGISHSKSGGHRFDFQRLSGPVPKGFSLFTRSSGYYGAFGKGGKVNATAAEKRIDPHRFSTDLLFSFIFCYDHDSRISHFGWNLFCVSWRLLHLSICQRVQ